MTTDESEQERHNAERIGRAILSMPPGSSLNRAGHGGWKWRGPNEEEFGYYEYLLDAIGRNVWKPYWEPE